MLTINEVCQRLNINPPLTQSTCIGYSQRKPTCGCAVALSSRQSADRTLKDIADNLHAGYDIPQNCLETLSSLLLCRRWHQFQSEDLVSKWSTALRTWTSRPSRRPEPSNRTIRDVGVSTEQYQRLRANFQLLKEEKEDLEYSLDDLTDRVREHGGLEYMILHEPRPILQPPAVTSSDIQRAGDGILIAELERRIQASRSFKRNTALHRITALLHARINSSASRSPAINNRSRHNRATEQQIPPYYCSSRAINPRSNSQTEVVSSSSELQSGQASSQSALDDDTDTSNNDTSHDNADGNGADDTSSNNGDDADTDADGSNEYTSDDSGSDVESEGFTDYVSNVRKAPQTPTRHSHTECAVCFEPYADGERENGRLWECDSCQNRTHLDCFSSWAEAADGRTVSCIYCRAAVSHASV